MKRSPSRWPVLRRRDRRPHGCRRHDSAAMLPRPARVGLVLWRLARRRADAVGNRRRDRGRVRLPGGRAADRPSGGARGGRYPRAFSFSGGLFTRGAPIPSVMCVGRFVCCPDTTVARAALGPARIPDGRDPDPLYPLGRHLRAVGADAVRRGSDRRRPNRTMASSAGAQALALAAFLPGRSSRRDNTVDLVASSGCRRRPCIRSSRPPTSTSDRCCSRRCSSSWPCWGVCS